VAARLRPLGDRRVHPGRGRRAGLGGPSHLDRHQRPGPVRHLHIGPGVPQNSTTTAACSAAAATSAPMNSRSSAASSMMKLTPKGRSVSSRTWVARRRTGSGGSPAAPSTPRPPAFDTAATSSGPAAALMPAHHTG
jgi:hypothetical protein